jgi:hypothetical protein
LERKKCRTWIAAFLLLATFPIHLSAAGQASGEPKEGLSRSFSLSLSEVPAVPPALTLAVPRILRPSTPRSSSLTSASSGASEFSFRSISSDFLKDAGQIWSYPVHIKTGDILPIVGLAALTGLRSQTTRRSTGRS